MVVQARVRCGWEMLVIGVLLCCGIGGSAQAADEASKVGAGSEWYPRHTC